MTSQLPPTLAHHGQRVLSARSAPVCALVALVAVVVACGFGGPAPAPTAVPTPAPIPRPTAEPPAAVNLWYAAAQSAPEEAVRVRADLSQAEIDRIRRALERRYPRIRVEWSRGADSDLLQTTLNELRAGTPNWDIYVGDSGPTLKSARSALRWTPPEARTVHPDLIDGEGGWYGIAATYHVLQYSTEQVPQAFVPKSYEALQHPGYFGRLAMEEQNIIWLKGLEETRDQDGAASLVRALAGQGVRFRPDARTLVAFITAGEQAVAIDARLEHVERDKRGGGKTGWIGIEPVIVQPLAMVVSAATDRPNGARLVANYLLSVDVQEILADHGRVPSRTDVDPEPQTLVRGLRTQLTLPPEGIAERDLRARWAALWGRR